jgi:4-hydroxybenzoate polyprenyltransferase
LYTYSFKNIPIYDIIMVAIMYVFRVVAGGVATGIHISQWIVVCTFFSALFIISAKRYAEYVNADALHSRKVLKFYTKESLQGILFSTATISVFAYTIYCILNFKNELAVYSSIIVASVFYIILNDILRGERRVETPEIYLLTNRKINFLILIWVIFMAYILY